MNERQKVQVRKALQEAGIQPEVYEDDFYMVALYQPHGEGSPSMAITLTNVQAAQEEARWYTTLRLKLSETL